jgi:hypothetical protein
VGVGQKDKRGPVALGRAYDLLFRSSMTLLVLSFGPPVFLRFNSRVGLNLWSSLNPLLQRRVLWRRSPWRMLKLGRSIVAATAL